MKTNYRIIIVFLILGLIDASYLTIVHFVPGTLACPTIGTAVNCESVLGSSFSNIFGVPLAILGLIWFLVSTTMLFLNTNRIFKNIWLIFGLGGIAYSIIAQSILGKICIYCSTLDVLIALSVGAFIYFKK